VSERDVVDEENEDGAALRPDEADEAATIS